MNLHPSRVAASCVAGAHIDSSLERFVWGDAGVQTITAGQREYRVVLDRLQIVGPVLFENLALSDPALWDPAIVVQMSAGFVVLDPAVLGLEAVGPVILVHEGADLETADLAVLDPAVLDPAVLDLAVVGLAVVGLAVVGLAVLDPAVVGLAVLDPAVVGLAVLGLVLLDFVPRNLAVAEPVVLNLVKLDPESLNLAVLVFEPGGPVVVGFGAENLGIAGLSNTGPAGLHSVPLYPLGMAWRQDYVEV